MDASFRAAQRVLTEWRPTLSPRDASPSLEASAAPLEPARVIAAAQLEDAVCRAHLVPGAPVVGCAAFLDGTQDSRVVQHVDGVPIVFGTAAAAIRVRVDRKLVTWDGASRGGGGLGEKEGEGEGEGESDAFASEAVAREVDTGAGPAPPHGGGVLVSRRFYLPRGRVPADLWRLAAARGFAPVDTSEPNDHADPAAAHPAALSERAVHAVQRGREALEQALGARWCARAHGVLLADGAINREERMASSPWVIGVVKSHRTLYVEGPALSVVFGLRAGERSSVLIVTSPRTVAVASWYLRLRSSPGASAAGASEPSGGGDPLFGLVRVEAALPPAMRADPAAAGRRADEVSRWVLAERLPLALPDGRWDRMAYGVRGVEEYLRAIV